jgi:hypothetical protein
VAALLGSGAALLCAAVPALCAFVVPLGVVGLVLGLGGLVRILAVNQGRLLLPAVGTTLGGVVLFTALLFPKILGPIYLTSRVRADVDPTVIRVVPLPGSPRNAAPANPDWVDASQAALHQGPLQVQVLAASFRPLQVQSSPTQKIPPGESLFIRLRIQHAQPAGALAAKGADRAGSRLDQASPRLTDPKGKVYPPRDVLEVAAVENQRRSSAGPVVVKDEVWRFEARPPARADLHLELPAEAWGGEGVFRFTIPASMIR